MNASATARAKAVARGENADIIELHSGPNTPHARPPQRRIWTTVPAANRISFPLLRGTHTRLRGGDVAETEQRHPRCASYKEGPHMPTDSRPIDPALTETPDDVADFAASHGLTEAQAYEILALVGPGKADAIVEKVRPSKTDTGELRPPLGAEFT